MMTGVNMVHVACHGGACAHRPFGRTSAGHVRQHSILRPAHQGWEAAATRSNSSRPSELLPKLPTVADFVPGFRCVYPGLINFPSIDRAGRQCLVSALHRMTLQGDETGFQLMIVTWAPSMLLVITRLFLPRSRA
jgi:hypothetical protein